MTRLKSQRIKVSHNQKETPHQHTVKTRSKAKRTPQYTSAPIQILECQAIMTKLWRYQTKFPRETGYSSKLCQNDQIGAGDEIRTHDL